MGQRHHRGTQVWHAFSRDCTVLAATHTFIHEWNEPYLLRPSRLIMQLETQPAMSIELTISQAESRNAGILCHQVYHQSRGGLGWEWELPITRMRALWGKVRKYYLTN